MSKRKAAEKPVAAKSKVGHDEAEFERLYDKDWKIPNAIKQGLKSLGTGWLKHTDFAKRCAIGVTDLGNYADKFSDHIVVLPHDRVKVWWGDAKLAEKWRQKLGAKPLGSD